jgi:predicted ATPase
MVLNEMEFNGSIKHVTRFLQRFNEHYQGLVVKVDVGIAQIFIRERGYPISAIRLSDGTLKFLCLLAVLFNPNAPPMVCIEEPELGLHPDALHLVALALIEASERMQVIVTTHSKDLVDALSTQPDAVVVCERDFEGSTQFRRLDKRKLKLWLDRYSLGELWRKGEIGGN